MRIAVAHMPVAIGNFGGLLECISMVAHQTFGNKIGNTMVVRLFIIFCSLKHHSDSPITIGTLFGKSDKLYMLMSNIIF